MEHRLKFLREKKGLTQKQLSQISGISQSHIAGIERNVRTMDLRLMGIFSKALGCEPYELLPQEWQPQQISDADLELLRAIKTLAKDKTNAEETQNPVKQKENNR